MQSLVCNFSPPLNISWRCLYISREYVLTLFHKYILFFYMMYHNQFNQSRDLCYFQSSATKNNAEINNPDMSFYIFWLFIDIDELSSIEVILIYFSPGFPGGPDGEESACDTGNLGSSPWLGRSPGEGNGYSLQYSCLENSMDRGAWQATVHGVTKSRTWPSN